MGGSLTYPLTGSPIALGTSLTLLRTLPLTQVTSLDNQGNQYPAAIESALDTLCMQIQQVNETAQLAIQIPVVDVTGTNTTLPVASVRANGFLSFDSSGNATISGNAPSVNIGLSATSTTTNTIGTGTQTFTIQSGKFFSVGQYLLITNATNAAEYMHGTVTSYTGTALVINVTDTGGSGTFSLWNVSISGTRGPTGASGSGTVSSVGMTGDGVIFNATVTGSPVTSTGTLVPALLTKTANTVLAGPTTGSAATPTFRALVAADIPVATSSANGAVQPDNSTITISGGVISAALNLSGQAQGWVRFHWTGSAISIAKSYNVSSVTRSGAGVYVVNMTNALADTNYAVIPAFTTGGIGAIFFEGFTANSTSQFTITIENAGGAGADPTYVVAVVYD